MVLVTEERMPLGQSLMCGQNRSLLTLKLDYNSSLGSDGCRRCVKV